MLFDTKRTHGHQEKGRTPTTGVLMSNIRKETGRHRFTWRPLPSLPGAHEAKKRGEAYYGWFCTNCRLACDPADGDPPVNGCLLETNAMQLGRAQMGDLTRQEGRLLHEQAQREYHDEIRAGARDASGRPVLR